MIDASSLAPMSLSKRVVLPHFLSRWLLLSPPGNDGACGLALADVDRLVCTCYVDDCLAEEGGRRYPRESGEMNRGLLHSCYGEQSAFPSSFLSRSMFTNQHRWMCTPGRGLRRTSPRVVRFQRPFARLPLLNSSPSR